MTGTVLCVDDDRNLCQILAKALRDEGFEVLTAFDGDEAVALIEKTGPDVVILDLILPRRDGFEVVESVRAMDGPTSETRFVIFSGCSPTPAYRERAEALGVEAFLTKPVPLVQLIETVGSVLGIEKSGEAETPPTEDADQGTKVKRMRTASTLSGSLRRVPFPALLHHLHGLRTSGVLHLESGKKRKWIELRDGHPVAVRSNLVNECLGHYLLRSGHIKQVDLDESRRRMRNGQLQGEILVAMEVLTEEEIAAALHAQADEKLFEVFSWKVGNFRFEKESTLESANTIGVKRSPANLILHGVRTRFAGDRIESYFQSNAECIVVRSESPYYRFQDIDLDPEHAALLEKLNGNRRVSEILARDSGGSLARTLYALVATGLLELQGGQSPGAPAQVSVASVSVTKPTEEDDERSSLQAMAERYGAQNYFEILGVDADAEVAAVEAAYVKLSESSHPDRFADSTEAVRQVAEEIFAHISRAYETLRDPRSRSQYRLDVRRERRAAAGEEKGQKALDAANQFQRGMALLNARSYEDALARFGRALELNPDEGDYRTHYGWTLHLCHPSNSSIIEEAIEHVRRGVKLASHADRAYLFMGRLLRAIGKPAAAERMFTRAVQIEPDCVEALRELRLINMRRERSKGLIRRMLRR